MRSGMFFEEKKMTLIGSVVKVILLIGVVMLAFAGINNYGKHQMDIGHIEGHAESIGRPMKYKDLPPGQYRVIAVVNEYSQTAVVKKESLADGLIRENAKEYFLVTDMMPQMMKKDYLWGEIQ